ncbi:hypothetical protein EO776_03585 [Halorubrum ezzemoulense]|uniref:DUF1102 domain-containing protein n=2 Tax=Halorubrum ezzemoulense TaxID=337243 RepID=A0A256K1C5_HALEZ|nr:hypothetical protein DJ84_24275 [Halorubrum ezzemoulense]QAY19130.1 hypothetical protein EO776_03585 [Halorubrum ezzemoulense]
MVVGLGALATGSGAVFSSAAFSASATSTADFRVVVEDNLVLEAGDSFRNGDGAYLDNPSGKFYGGSDDLFSGDSGLNGLEPDELPAAYANDRTNSDLEVETAVQNFEEFKFDNFLQVTNEGTETREVGIRFNLYGADVNDGPIKKQDLIQAYEFYNEGGDGGKISTNGSPGGSVSSQTLKATTSVNPGETEQIGLKIDLTVGSISDDIAEAAAPGTNDVFNGGGEYDTVHLVESIRVGSDSAGD